MQRIRFIDSVATSTDSYKNREIYEVSDETAEYMMRYGFAVPLLEEGEGTEKAEKSEKAEKPEKNPQKAKKLTRESV